MNRHRVLAAIGCTGLVAVSAAAGGLAPPAGASGAPAFSATETITRNHLVSGADQVVDTRTVKVTVSTTTDLRDRQPVDVSWSGAHPTGGLIPDQNSAGADQQEYPVVVMECRGTDSASLPADQRVSPATCWTQTTDERVAYAQDGSNYPAWRMDRYAVTADRAHTVGVPDPYPSTCSQSIGGDAQVWIPFDAVGAKVYAGGPQGCGGLAPEMTDPRQGSAAVSLQPGNTTYGVADLSGNGSTKFIVQSSDSNASIGCSDTVPCSLEIIPIMGVSCDAAGTAPAPGGLPVADQPTSDLIPTIFANCSQTGHFQPGTFAGSGETADVAVSGQLWWTASNWRNRISVPLTFRQPASVCDVVSNQASLYLYGSEALSQATQQWAPSFCLNPKLFNVRHVQTSEPQAKNLLAIGNVEAAIQGSPPTTPFTKPTVQAPTALTAWAIAYSIDDANGHTVPTIKLDARLIAKLLSESYRSCAGACLDFTSFDSIDSGFAAMATNPYDISRDPEFQALNPTVPPTNSLVSAAALSVMSSDSDVMYALSSYINNDPEARAWLNGKRDPWGMIVNPAYRNIALPVTNWPLSDTHLLQDPNGAYPCLDGQDIPWLPQVASPLSDPATIALDLQFDIANAQTVCQASATGNVQKLVSVGREPSGSRFILGLVPLADAQRYQLNVAQLQTHNASNPTAQFSNADGRTFVGPSNASLQSAGSFLTPDDAEGTWDLPYGTLRTSTKAEGAYPGTMLLSTDVQTTGVPAADAARYGQFLRFVAGPGQSPGVGNGQLPDGYLPMTSADGLGRLAAYTNAAADAVAAQRCVVPFVSGKPTTVTSCPTTSVGGSTPLVTAPSTVKPGSPLLPPTKIPPGTTTTAPGSTSTPAIVTVEKTLGLGAGPLGLALPLCALLGIIALGGAAWISGVGRR